MGYDKNLDAGLADRCGNGSQIVQQPDFFGDAFDQRPEVAAIGQEITLGINEEQGRPVPRIATVHHLTSPSDCPLPSFPKRLPPTFFDCKARPIGTMRNAQCIRNCERIKRSIASASRKRTMARPVIAKDRGSIPRFT